MKNDKIIKKSIILMVIVLILLFIVYSGFVFRAQNPAEAFHIWKSIAVKDNSIYIIQRGTYPSGDPDISPKGYVFASYDCSPESAMNQMGFYNIGHTYQDGKSECTEYCTSEAGLHTIIEGRIPYFGGYLLEYRVVGMC